MKYKYTKEEFVEAVKVSFGIASVCRKLGIRPCGGNYKTLHAKIKEWDVDTTHFTGSAWNQGDKFKEFKPKLPLEDILVKDSTHKNTGSLKRRLYSNNIKTKQCEKCKITEWNGEEIVFELEHINGDNTDNRLENLSILCPNCHSQTPTFRNKKRAL